MDNENKVEEGVDTQESDTTSEGKGEKQETKPAKRQFTDEEQYAIHQRELKKLEKKLEIKEPESKQTKSDDFDYGQLAYLAAKGIEGEKEMARVKEIMAETGRDLKSVLGSKFVQAELKEMREAQASADAIPKGTKRTSTNAVNDVDYWIAKGELPADTPENYDLRQKIVLEEIAREKKKNIFAGSSGKLIIK